MGLESTSGRSLSKDTVDTCLTLLRRLQDPHSSTAKERTAARHLAEWLAQMDMSDSSDTDEALDEPSRALLESYTDRGRRRKFVRGLEEAIGSSPSLRSSAVIKLPRLEGQDELVAELEKLDNWSTFDVFKVARLSHGKPLQKVTLALLDHFDLVGKLQLERMKVTSFLQEIEGAYNPQNPYHNSIHAADVTQSLGCLLINDEFSTQLSDMELLSMIIAAAVHDVGHPGFSNEFLVNTAADIALQYNDSSVNENMHAATAFQIFLKPQNNFLAHLSDNHYRFFRRTVISIVLATDMAAHADLVNDFSDGIKLLGKNLLGWHPEKKIQAMQMVVHSADIANPAKPLRFSQQWVDRVLREFFAQGDIEKRKGMAVSPQCDRDKVEIARSQLAFLERVVKPCYLTLQMLAPNAAGVALHICEGAKVHWESLLCPAGQKEQLPGILQGTKDPSNAFRKSSSELKLFELEDI